MKRVTWIVNIVILSTIWQFEGSRQQTKDTINKPMAPENCGFTITSWAAEMTLEGVIDSWGEGNTKNHCPTSVALLSTFAASCTGNSNRNVRGVFPSTNSVMSQPAVRLDHILVTLGLISTTTTKIPWIQRGKISSTTTTVTKANEIGTTPYAK